MATKVYGREVELFSQHGGRLGWSKCYRNQLGVDVILEALRLWRGRRRKKLDVLLRYARMRHVERSMRPYLEAAQ